MRKGIRRLISRLAEAMHGEVKREMRGQHKQVLARVAESDRTLTRALDEQMASVARTQKRLERMLREVSQRQQEIRPG